MLSRRTFIHGAATSAATFALTATAKSYARIMGANDRINFGIIGISNRGLAHLSGLKANASIAHVTHICDVDSRVLSRSAGKAQVALGYAPTATVDFRRVLDAKEVDAITIATPDHWHAPMAVLALRAGKHVYVEKPSSHNPREDELLILAQKKYKKLVQVGNQHRSCAHEARIVQQIHDGRIGKAYSGKAWYANTRPSMGVGKATPVPAELDWDLWQGPAPRSTYKDNINPYNWHWLRRYGTGELLNNGTHEIDVCRWALGVDYPDRVAAQGGRYHFDDDWEFYDTLVLSLAYPHKIISWEGKSCQGMKYFGRDRGALIQGTEGSVIMALDGYEVYDLSGKLVEQFTTNKKAASSDLLSQDEMTNAHLLNFINGIGSGEALRSPIADIAISITSLQLGNIAWMTGRELAIDPSNGHIKDDSEAMKHWSRPYENGWEIAV